MTDHEATVPPTTAQRARRAACLLLLPATLVLGLLPAPAQARPRTVEDLRVSTALPRSAEAEGPVTRLGVPHGEDKLGAHDREVLAGASGSGSPTVTTLVATERGATAAVVASLEALGGRVGYRDDRLGYVRAVLPVGAVERAAELRRVASVDLNTVVRRDDPAPEALGRARAQVVAPGRATPHVNAYLPTNETGATTFTGAHRTWDGRGVTIGVLDSGVDLDHPALQETSSGARKIVDWVSATDPLLDSDPTWRVMLTEVSGPTFQAEEGSWTAPAGSYRFNRFSESDAAGPAYGGDVNRDGDTTDAWGVLYRPGDHAVWVDTDADHDFTDEELRRPYGVARQVGHFGDDDPATPVRESVPFVVEYREDVDLGPAGLAGQTADFVNIGLVADQHGSHVAGIAAGHALFGGTVDGAAPGARVVSSRACRFDGGCTDIALVEGMIDLVVRRHVDVVNMSIGGLPALNDGDNTRATVYDRLVEDYGVQLVLSAGNSGPGLNTVGDPSVADNVLSVAAGISRATALANYGAAVSATHALLGFSARGPREDGGMKPDLSAPGSAVSTTPLWLPGEAVAEAGYELPPGYAMMNGTSMAAPQVAGGAALLLSAGRASDIPVTSAQLRSAIRSSADFDTAVTAAGQGVGELDVVGAWDLLRRDAALVPGRIEVAAPVCTPLAGLLQPAGSGPGLYNRCAGADGGPRAGVSTSYPVTLTRRSGAAGTRSHTLRWLGNDGTFSAPTTVALPRGKAVRVSVKAKPAAGAHSAVLRIDDPGTYGVDGFLPATVVVSSALAAPAFERSFTSRVERLRAKSYYVTVPPGTDALRVALSGIAAGSRVNVQAFHPYGLEADEPADIGCSTNVADPSGCDALVRSYPDPLPGVWQLVVQGARTTPFLSNPYRLTASAVGVELSPALTAVSSVAVDAPAALEWTVTGAQAPTSVRAAGGRLGSAFSDRPEIGDAESDTFQVAVPPGTERLDVTIGNPGDPAADLDLAVLRDGQLVAQDAVDGSAESVSLLRPAAGTYTVEVYGYDVAGPTRYDYRDVLYGEPLGVLEVSAGPRALARSQAVVLSGSVRALAVPAAGRGLFAELLLLEPGGGVLERAGVLVRQVAAA